jgi:membrane protease YdiL (CAAX protease family)
MNNLHSEARSAGGGHPDELLASRRHTLYFLAIWLAVTAAGVLSAVLNKGPARAHGPNDMIPFYLFLIGMQVLWVRFVNKGMRSRGHSILEFFGLPRFRPAQLAQDIGYAALSYALIYGCVALIGHWSHPDAQPANVVLPRLPTGALAMSVWIGVSLTAGICEEIVFRGYLQRQLAAMTGRPVIAILVQAILFGIGHAYEGPGAVADIVVIGLILGGLAAWRGNIRAAILVHAALDILAGFGLG